MLDMGFEPQITEEYLTNPVQVKVGKVSSPTENVSQNLEKISESEKVSQFSLVPLFLVWSCFARDYCGRSMFSKPKTIEIHLIGLDQDIQNLHAFFDSSARMLLSISSIHNLHSLDHLHFLCTRTPSPIPFQMFLCTLLCPSLHDLQWRNLQIFLKYFPKSYEILKSLFQIHRSLFLTTLMVWRPHTTRCLPSSPTSA
ncbi:hypothetical protein LXL04_023502 [Taraxacum kok-saghyz]